jgi:hypothetical protein
VSGGRFAREINNCVTSSKDAVSWEGSQRAISLLPEKLSSIQNGQDRIGFKLELEEDFA